MNFLEVDLDFCLTGLGYYPVQRLVPYDGMDTSDDDLYLEFCIDDFKRKARAVQDKLRVRLRRVHRRFHATAAGSTEGKGEGKQSKAVVQLMKEEKIEKHPRLSSASTTTLFFDLPPSTVTLESMPLLASDDSSQNLKTQKKMAMDER